MADWVEAHIGSYLARTETRDPRKRPDDKFVYVDVSSVDNSLFQIVDPSLLAGRCAPSRARKVVRARDVIYATVRPALRRVALVPPRYDDQVCSTGFCVLRTKQELDAEFLYYWLLTDDITKRVEGIQRGASYPAIRDSDVKKLPIRVPQLPEQRRIAALLSAVQQAVEQQARLIALTAELKKALMHKLFTEGTRGEPQKETEIGLIPESWELVRLGQLLDIKHGYAFQGEYFREAGEFILMTPGHFREEGGFRSQDRNTKYYVGPIPQGYVLSGGDLLIAMTEQKGGLLGSSAFVPETGKYLHNQRLGLVEIVDPSRLERAFLHHLLNLPSIRGEIAATASGSKVRHTSPSKIRDVKIGLPGALEQELITESLSRVDGKLGVHSCKIEVLQALFRTLLHQLMTAEHRVDQVDMSELEALGIQVE